MSSKPWPKLFIHSIDACSEPPLLDPDTQVRHCIT
jgi:hypothetical protein